MSGWGVWLLVMEGSCLRLEVRVEESLLAKISHYRWGHGSLMLFASRYLHKLMANTGHGDAFVML